VIWPHGDQERRIRVSARGRITTLMFVGSRRSTGCGPSVRRRSAPPRVRFFGRGLHGPRVDRFQQDLGTVGARRQCDARFQARRCSASVQRPAGYPPFRAARLRLMSGAKKKIPPRFAFRRTSAGFCRRSSQETTRSGGRSPQGRAGGRSPQTLILAEDVGGGPENCATGRRRVDLGWGAAEVRDHLSRNKHAAPWSAS